MRSKLLQALLGFTARATRASSHISAVYCIPKPIIVVPPVASPPLTSFGQGAQAPLVVRAAILSQARTLHLTPTLCKKRKRGAKVADNCSGRTKRRRSGFNKPCPPPPCICPPGTTPPCKHKEECADGFGELPKRKGKKHHKK